MAEHGTDESEDSRLDFDDELFDYFNRDHVSADDHSLTKEEADRIFELYIDEWFRDYEPLPQVDLPCLQCGRLVTDEFEDSWVWIHNPDPDGERPFVPFCNSMHRDIYFKQGIWAELKLTGLPALSLDEDDEE